MVGSVGGLGDVQCPLEQGPGLVGLAQIARRPGEVAHPGGDIGVVRSEALVI